MRRQTGELRKQLGLLSRQQAEIVKELAAQREQQREESLRERRRQEEQAKEMVKLLDAMRVKIEQKLA